MPKSQTKFGEMLKVVWSCLIFSAAVAGYRLRCNRTLEGVAAKPNPGHFQIEISGNPATYVPGEQYTVFLRNTRKADADEKFAGFILTFENEKRTTSTPTIQLYGDSLTKFSEECPSTVVSADSQPKSEIQVLWLAPATGNGCVSFKGAVIVSDLVWYGEDGPLTKTLCENSQDSDDIQPHVLKHCCACDEAKYEVSRDIFYFRVALLLDFSPDCELIKRKKIDIIGASHTVNYTFWKYGDIASEGLRQLAENGNTRMLESELKAKSDHIRTIIKARGISYPNITGKTFAVFRVDNRHHLMSIVSMIDPSPDWIVGVSSLELCMRNCSWVESKILNLYPWDAGTDDGITYTSPNQPSSPRQPIRRIKSTAPNDPRSPFYDKSGAEMKPLARLYLSRQRLYEKVCDPSIGEDNYEDNDNCETEEWSDWSPCSATCGRGVKYKQRRYKNEESKYICHKRLTERAGCEAVQKYCPHTPTREVEDPLCVLGPWSEWSSCSVTCGKGTKTRDRKYKNRLASKTCAATKINPPKLQENLECFAEGNCDDLEDEELLKNCPPKPWTEWSPCSATCGKGFKVRYRLSLHSRNWPFVPTETNYDDTEEFDEDDPCTHQKLKETVECLQKPCGAEVLPEKGYVCSLPRDVGSCKSNVDRWYFDNIKGNCEIFSYSGCDGNSNNFRTLEQCQKVCADYQKELIANLTAHKRQLDVTISGVLSYNIQNDAINGNNCVSAPSYRPYSQIQLTSPNVTDCEMTKWSNWSPCNVTGYCGNGYRTKYRQIKVQPSDGGKPCSKRLTKRKKCHVPCSNELSRTQYNLNTFDNIRVDCVMSTWSSWTKCDKCSKGQYQERYRHVLVHPTPNGTPCPSKIEKRPCVCKGRQ